MIYTGFVLIMLSFFILLTSFASLQKTKITRFARSFSSAVSIMQKGNSIEDGPVLHDKGVIPVSKEDRVAILFEKIRALGTRYDLEGIDIRRGQRGVVMTLSDTLLFGSGEARLAPQAFLLLKKIGAVIGRIDAPVEIEGHTDNVPIHTEAFASNWELSTARAINVLRFMIKQQDMDNKQISATGRSEYHPLYPKNSLENRSANRRVEFIFGVD